MNQTLQFIQQSFSEFSLYLNDIDTKKTNNTQDSLLTSFTTSFLTILVCQIGDKTFFLAMILAMKYNKMIVFIGSWGALVVMTIVSAVGGKVVFSVLPKLYTNIIVTILFFYFGLRLLYEAYHQEDDQHGENQQLKQVQMQIKEMEQNLIRKSQQKLQIQLDDKMGPSKINNKSLITDRMILTQAFIMTFLAEWGDRSQIATIALAASYNLLMVNIGAILGHFLCTGGAVQLGEWISKRVSQKYVHYAAGIVFLLSGAVTLYLIFEEEPSA